ncbi:3-hydroxyacyl-CoA dehydrogenase family protein [Hydrotalea sp.]|uniref:3-hydroxyacyl-CoA dehydrogenase family protein n=1 Tax=Hydrotalea sp. TaxID=2881279 RepID=UPI003D0D4188
MTILVNANEQQMQVFLQKPISETMQVLQYNGSGILNADAYFDFLFEEEGPVFSTVTNAPVFVNAVITPTQKMPKNFIRFNGWPYFLERNVWELTNIHSDIQKTAELILQQMSIKPIWCADIPGFIAARSIAAIINEAYFALGESVSTVEDINTAMRLGTNYPLGPFEWVNIIGQKRIVQLMYAMQQQNQQYQIAPLLLTSSANK